MNITKTLYMKNVVHEYYEGLVWRMLCLILRKPYMKNVVHEQLKLWTVKSVVHEYFA